ncbi:MAG: tRNA A-37 threonylcarbamoyl transferase component Bud32 [Candidatus Alkanophagales archaeon MCA70_species_2]|nr:tRNA A-37 threonylcarbamoyl transferase component Bud32 [Candidatus Alkanophaga liquidiphilum]
MTSDTAQLPGLRRCAEAVVEIRSDRVFKTRISKGYRIKELDERLRRERTRMEAKIIADARKAGVPTPIILDVDDVEFRITMERVRGEVVRDVLERLPLPERIKLCERIGETVGKLHDAGIVHGDLTTSNMILSDDGRLYLIDFGLAFYERSVEARGVDVHVFFQTLVGTHEHHETLSEAFARGYKRTFPKAEEVLKRAKEIETRGRFVERRLTQT